MSEKENLLRQIQTCCFVLIETTLFLDAHPTCQQALAYFKKYQEMEKQLRMQYTQKFGALSLQENSDTTRWTWTDSPWPWELEE